MIFEKNVPKAKENNGKTESKADDGWHVVSK